MRRIFYIVVFVVLVVSAAPTAAVEATRTGETSSSSAIPGECTAEQHERNRQRLAAYQRAMSPERRSFFRAHKNPRVRRAFVLRQQAKLRALKLAAACRVVSRGAEIVASISVAGSGGVGFGADRVWVIDRTAGLVEIDPMKNIVVGAIPGVVGAVPVVGEGAVWVPSGTPFYNRLLRVDPQARTFIRIATGPLADEWPTTAAITPGAVWVGNHHGGAIARVDPSTNAVVASVPWSGPTFGGVYHMAADRSTVWATGSRTTDATEIDAATNSIVRRVPVPTGTCGGIDVDPSSVWVASGFDQPYPCWQQANWGVSRIDRSTGRVTRLDVGGRPIDVRVAFGSLWVVVDVPNLQLVRIDPANNTVVGRLSLDESPCRPIPAVAGACPRAEYTTSLAVGFGSLWVRVNSSDEGAGKLLRIDPS